MCGIRTFGHCRYLSFYVERKRVQNPKIKVSPNTTTCPLATAYWRSKQTHVVDRKYNDSDVTTERSNHTHTLQTEQGAAKKEDH